MSSRVGGDEVGRLEIGAVVESEYASMLAIGSRNVVVLHYVHDLTVETISETLEIPVGTVKSDLSRARARLRSAMEEGP